MIGAQYRPRAPLRPVDAGLLCRSSFIREIGKFLSRDFQDNIDAFEQIVEPRLGVTRERACALDGDSDAISHGCHRHDRWIYRISRPRLEHLRSSRSNTEPGAHHYSF